MNCCPIQNESQTLEETTKIILVPKHAMGRVIGRGGQVIQALGMPNGCKLDFNRAEENELGETPLKITSLSGNPSDCLAVLGKVKAIVSIIVYFLFPLSCKSKFEVF
jgi:predicted PilT family ATPase